jgi:hypothetical protein
VWSRALLPGSTLIKGIMKYKSLLLSFLAASSLLAQELKAQALSQAAPIVQTQAVHLATALNHLTVLEFGEPVTQAAAGSTAFNIEWRDNKVLIKPLKPGVSTNLFVWTTLRRFTYELDPPGEVKNMNFAVDNPVVPIKPAPETNAEQMIQVADMMMTRALLGADRIESGDIKSKKGQVVVRIENVFQSSNSLYIRYAITNLTERPYRVLDPAVWELAPPETTLSLRTLRRTQLDDHKTKKLGAKKRTPLTVASSEAGEVDLRPSDETHGVIVLRKRASEPTVIEIAFANAGDRHVAATFVY